MGMQFYVQPGREIEIIKIISEQFYLPVFILPDMPNILKYSLSDGLWMLALSMTIILIWEFKACRSFYVMYSLSLLAALGFEIFQINQLIPGTFDPFDCIAILIGGGIPFYFTYKSSSYEPTC